jgi:hypothetical protein
MSDAPPSGRVYPPPVLALYAAATRVGITLGGPVDLLASLGRLHEALQAIGWDITATGPLDHPVDQHPGLYTTRQRFDQVNAKLDAIAHRLDDLEALGNLYRARAEARPDAPTQGACICGPRGDGTGDSGNDPDPDCPHHGREAMPPECECDIAWPDVRTGPCPIHNPDPG